MSINLRSLIGQNIKGSTFQHFLREITIPPEIHKPDYEVSRRFNYEYWYYYNFKVLGISFSILESGIIHNIFLYSEAADEFRQYQGNLPYGLSFAMTRREIEKNLGQPDLIGGNDILKTYVNYDTKRISITYESTQMDDLDTWIHHIDVR